MGASAGAGYFMGTCVNFCRGGSGWWVFVGSEVLGVVSAVGDERAAWVLRVAYARTLFVLFTEALERPLAAVFPAKEEEG